MFYMCIIIVKIDDVNSYLEYREVNIVKGEFVKIIIIDVGNKFFLVKIIFIDCKGVFYYIDVVMFRINFGMEFVDF